MSIALILIEDAYHMIGVKNSEVALIPSEIEIAVRHLNRVMLRYESNGLHFGQSKVLDETGNTNIPDWAEELIISSLAISLAPSFSMQVDPALLMLKDEALSSVRRILVDTPCSRLPSILPVGAGNYQYNYRRKFFPRPEQSLNDGHSSIHDEEGHDIHVDTHHEHKGHN